MLKPSLEIMQKISQGHEQSFTEAFYFFYPSLSLYAEKYLHDHDESNSLVQQVFVDLWIKREKLVVEQSLQAYLYKSVKNYSLDYLKHKAVEKKYLKELEPEPSIFDHHYIEEVELSRRINLAIEDLPDKCREIFTLCRFNGLSYNEIALNLGISVKTVEMQMGIAMKKLRIKLCDVLSSHFKPCAASKK